MCGEWDIRKNIQLEYDSLHTTSSLDGDSKLAIYFRKVFLHTAVEDEFIESKF